MSAPESAMPQRFPGAVEAPGADEKRLAEMAGCEFGTRGQLEFESRRGKGPDGL